MLPELTDYPCHHTALLSLAGRTRKVDAVALEQNELFLDPPVNGQPPAICCSAATACRRDNHLHSHPARMAHSSHLLLG